MWEFKAMAFVLEYVVQVRIGDGCRIPNNGKMNKAI